MRKKFFMPLVQVLMLVFCVYFLWCFVEFSLSIKELPELEVVKGEEKVKALRELVKDLRYFPVAKDKKKGECVNYEDSYGGARSYGGERKHEGIDLMASNNKRGYFPIVSVTDGVVEKKGWLRLGGYRLGIRAPEGAYFYYAHLDRYAEGLEEGSEVKAGQIIGYMGDSGYGPEGTVGQFDVHLHFGIYLTVDKKEISVNPYKILRQLENFQTDFP